MLNYCLVIADLRLPDGDGLEIAEHAADLGAVTFIMSSYLFQLERGTASRHELLMKPLRPSELVTAVQRRIGSGVPSPLARSKFLRCFIFAWRHVGRPRLHRVPISPD